MTLIVYDLAKRAERHSDPYERLAEMYYVAELAWVRASSRLFRNGWARLAPLSICFLDRLQSYQMRDGKLTITW